MTKITKKSFPLSENNYRKINDFIQLCNQKTELHQIVKEKSIEIKLQHNFPFFDTFGKPLVIKKPQNLSISDDDIIRIADQFVSILRDPFTFSELLKDLDDELGKAMKKNGLHFNDNDLPEFIISGRTHFIPGPPSLNYCPKRKGRLLDKILLQREMKSGINKEGVSAKFLGFVDKEFADPFVASGHIFTENTLISQLLMHGSFSHRFALEVVRQGVKNGRLSLKYNNNTEELSMQEFLTLLTYTYYSDGYTIINIPPLWTSLWSLTIDDVGDSISPHGNELFGENLCNPDNYSFSSRSPFVLNSLLLCFGKELGLPNLQYYLLDSHYKTAYYMVYRLKYRSKLPEITDNIFYMYCMQELSLAGDEPGKFIDVSFTLSKMDMRKYLYSSYEYFNSEHPIGCLTGIVKRKAELPKPNGYWPSLFHYINKKTDSIIKNTIEDPIEQCNQVQFF